MEGISRETESSTKVSYILVNDIGSTNTLWCLYDKEGQSDKELRIVTMRDNSETNVLSIILATGLKAIYSLFKLE